MPYFVPSVGNSDFRLLTSFQKKIKCTKDASKWKEIVTRFEECLSKLHGVKKFLCTNQGNHIT